MVIVGVFWSVLSRLSIILFFFFQVASLFASYILGYLAASKMQSILVTHMVRQMTFFKIPHQLIISFLFPNSSIRSQNVVWLSACVGDSCVVPSISKSLQRLSSEL